MAVANPKNAKLGEKLEIFEFIIFQHIFKEILKLCYLSQFLSKSSIIFEGDNL